MKKVIEVQIHLQMTILWWTKLGMKLKLVKRLHTWGFVVVDINPVQLEITVAVVSSSWVDAMLVTDDFPELKGKTKVIWSGNVGLK